MEALRDSAGFFGPSLFADITLVIQILFYLVLCAGVVAQLQGKYKWHDRLQTPIVVLNIFFIVLVMVPAMRTAAGAGDVTQVPRLVASIHALLGTVAQLLAIYGLLAGFKILPRRIGVLRYWMWAAYTAWTAAVIFGISVYIVFYTPFLATPGEVVVAEHDADLEPEPEPTAESPAESVAEVPTETAVPVEEHAEEMVAAEPSEEPVQAPAEGEPAEGVVAEHDEEVVAPEPAATGETAAPVDTGPAVADVDTFPMDELISEHMGDVVEIIEPEFTGEMAKALWLKVETTNAGPAPRYEHAMQYNAATNQIFVFGGRDGTRIFDDVWALDMRTFSWQELAINSPAAPVARFSSVMMVDEAGENLYIATGQTQGGRNFNDVWRLDLAAETWQDVTQAAGQGPEARYGGPGGNLGGNLVLTHGFGSTRYDDTWQFNVGTGQWENITPAGTVPLRRCLFAATPSEANLVIHGGCASGFGDCFLDDTWVLDTAAQAWREVLSDLKPVGRQYHSLIAAGPGSNRIILFGGQDASREARTDIWFLDLTTGNWQPVDASGEPGARYQHAAAWIPGRGMLVYGGRDDGPLGDLWLLETQAPPTPEPPPPSATPAPPPTSTPEPPTPTPELISEHDGG